jgi:hypothetical protein
MEQNGPGMAFGVLSLNAIVNIPEEPIANCIW